MKRIRGMVSFFSSSLNVLVSRAEAEHPELPEVASMVYVGDVYVLREQDHVRQADGWGKFRYSCEEENCLRLP